MCSPLSKELTFKQKGIVRQAHIGFITSYKSTYDFVNIWLIKDGKVKNISVGGDTSFDSGDWFDPNTTVVISYH